MPVKPDSRFAKLSTLQTTAPDGSRRQVIALRLTVPPVEGRLTRHLVRQGESIDELARDYYGSENLWWRILDANELVFPLDIEPGDELDIPDRGSATRVTRARRF
jgi:nucleoid-associated protein YgaU